jgi:outer membrane receptor protein involved in Fe transport
LGPNVDGFAGATVSYIGKRNAEFTERNPDGSLIRIPGYTEVDLRAGANVGQFTIEAFVHNLFDKGGIVDAFGFGPGNFPGGAAAASVIRPRTIGVTLTAGFGS